MSALKPENHDHRKEGKPWLDMGPAQGQHSDEERKEVFKESQVERCLGGGRTKSFFLSRESLAGLMYLPPLGAERPGFLHSLRLTVDAAQQSLRGAGGTLVLLTLWEQRCRDCVPFQECVWSQSGVCDLERSIIGWVGCLAESDQSSLPSAVSFP